MIIRMKKIEEDSLDIQVFFYQLLQRLPICTDKVNLQL